MPRVEINEIVNKDPIVLTIGSSSGAFFTAHFPCEVAEYSACYQIQSASGTLQLEKLRDGVAPGSGDNILSSTISTADSGAVNEMIYGQLAIGTVRQLARGERLANKLAGGSSGLYGLLNTVLITPLGKGHYLAHGTATRIA